MYKPLVSIIIPVYNGENYLAEAIESALAQTYNNIEIIVINDGSTDGGATERVALSYGDKINYIKKENGGSSSALNVGIENMSGRWFSWLSHDDLYYPNKIEKQIQVLNNVLLQSGEENIEEQLVTCASEIIGASGKKIYRPNNRKIKHELNIVNNYSNVEIAVEMLRNITFYGCSFLLPKNCFHKIGKFDENLKLLNDIDYWFRLLRNDYKFHYVPDILVSQRMHKKQISHQIGFSYNNREQDYFWESIINWVKDKDLNNKAKCFYRIGKYALHKGRYTDSEKSFKICLELNPKYRFNIMYSKIYIRAYSKLRSYIKRIYLAIKL